MVTISTKQIQLKTHSFVMWCPTEKKEEEWKGKVNLSNGRKWNKINETVWHGMKLEENFHEKIKNSILGLIKPWIGLEIKWWNNLWS